MSNKKEIFSMDLENIEKLLEESKLQLDLTEEHLKHQLLDKEHTNQMLICLLSEYYSCNFMLVKEIKNCLEYNAIVDHDDKKELILTFQNISILESSAIGRYIMVKQLADYNVSIYMN